MKKIVILLVIFVASYGAYAQSDENVYNYKNDFKLTLFNLVNSTIDVSYERMISSNKSLVLRGAVKWRDNGYERELGGMGELQYRYYLVKRDNPRHPMFKIDLYVAPYVFYKYLEDNSSDIYYGDIYNAQTGYYEPYYVDDVTYTNYGGGMYFGVKALAFKKMTVDLSVGGGVKIADSDIELLDHYYSYSVFGSSQSSEMD